VLFKKVASLLGQRAVLKIKISMLSPFRSTVRLYLLLRLTFLAASLLIKLREKWSKQVHYYLGTMSAPSLCASVTS